MPEPEPRIPTVRAMPIVGELVAGLEPLPAALRVQYCGALRRLARPGADVDIVVASREPDGRARAFVTLPAVREVIGSDDTRTSVADLDGAAGRSADRRARAVRRRLPVLHGLARRTTSSSASAPSIAGGRSTSTGSPTSNRQGDRVRTEEAIYAALGLPSRSRHRCARIAARSRQSERARFRRRIRLGDVRGDLHVHTTLSGDGRSTLEEVLDAATGRGYAYLAITDHAEDLAINGATREQLTRPARSRSTGCAGATRT